MIRATRMLGLLCSILLLIQVGCGFKIEAQLAGGMTVQENHINGRTTCRIAAQNRSVSDILDVLESKLEPPLIIDETIDLDRRLEAVDTSAEDWQTVLTELAPALKIQVSVEEDGIYLSPAS